MDTRVETVETESGKYVIEMTLRLTPGDKCAFDAVMQCAALALSASNRKDEVNPSGCFDAMPADWQRKAEEMQLQLNEAYGRISELTLDLQRLQAQASLR